MARLVWTTDIHFDFISPAARRAFLDIVIAQAPDFFLITGDIGEAPTTPSYLQEIVDYMPCPVYFVLGNHDYYFSDVSTVRKAIHRLCAGQPRLNYLSECGVIRLSENAVMIGHDGWSDGGYGDFIASEVMWADYVNIADLSNMGVDKRLQQLRMLGEESAAYLRSQIPIAAEQAKQIYLLMHPVPFRETCLYQGVIAEPDDPYLPHCACRAVGDMLNEIIREYPHNEFTLLCGHTHEGCDVQIAPNLRVIVGQAEYEHPVINGVFEV